MDYNNAFYSGKCLEILKILRLFTTVNSTANFRVLLIRIKDWYLAILFISWGSFKEDFFPIYSSVFVFLLPFEQKLAEL